MSPPPELDVLELGERVAWWLAWRAAGSPGYLRRVELLVEPVAGD